MAQGKVKVEASTQAYLPISEIKEGVVVMKDHSLRSVIIVSSVNFALKSENEKNAILSSYQSFLNSLSFPIQILATSRKIDLSNYLNTVKEAEKTQDNPLLRVQTDEYISFLKELLEYSNIMEKRFFVVLPFYPSGINEITSLPNPLAKKAAPTVPFEDQKKEIAQRVEVIITGLTSVGLRCAALGTEDLLELYYTLYNPDTAKGEKIKGAQDIDIPMVTASEGPEGAQI
jgi:type IV secretory pathway VirB4 component